MDEINIWNSTIGPVIEKASYVAAFCFFIGLIYLYRDRNWHRNKREEDRVSFDAKQQGWIQNGLNLALIVEKNTAATREANDLSKQQAGISQRIEIALARITGTASAER